jgi:exonuclease SbcD
MKFIHTADWHLGRTLHGVSLLDDQYHVLQNLCDIVREESPDCVIVAGDIYDRAIPAADAVSLLDEILCRLLLDLKTPVFLIAGNHDSPERIGFASRLLNDRGLHVAGPLPAASGIRLGVGAGACEIFLLPYAEPAVHRERFADPEISSHDKALSAAVARIATARTPGIPAVLVGHAFVEGGASSESERPLSVGGVETVSAAHFAPFDYVALGHLHRAQAISEDAVRYSGSILKYSFSEANDVKSVNVVELENSVPPRVRSVPLSPRHGLSALEGHFAKLLKEGAALPQRDHYLSIDLLDEIMPLDAMGQLREVFPNLLHIDRRQLRIAAEESDQNRRDHRKVGHEEMFRAFYEEVTAGRISEDQTGTLREALADLETLEAAQ